MSKTDPYFGIQVEHRHGGNGYVVVQHLRDDYCRVVGCGFRDKDGNWNLGKQFLLAWKKMLRPWKEIPPDALTIVEGIRAKLESGDARIVNTRLVDAAAK